MYAIRSYYDQPHEGVLEQQVETLAGELRAVVVDIPGDPLGEVGLDLGHRRAHRIGDPDRGLLADPEDIEADGPLAVVGGVAVAVLEVLAHRGDILEIV